jgi:hypothetical protein
VPINFRRALLESHKQAVRAARLGKKASPETQAKMSQTRRDKPLTPKQQQAIQIRQISEKARKKMSKGVKKRILSAEQREKRSQRRHSLETR